MNFTESNRRLGTIVFLAGVVVFAVIIIGPCRLFPWLPFCEVPPPPPPTNSTPTVPPGAVAISIYSSDTKQDWLNLVTEAFNAAQITTSAGQPIFVQVFQVK